MPAARFWEFAHLSDDFKTMPWVDTVPRAGKLFIGGLHALYQKPDQFVAEGITHILSVLDYDIYEGGQFEQYKHLMLRVDDDPNENLLQHFTETNAFIEEALASGGGVFVHCAMGKSRSATMVCAHLMKQYNMSPKAALAQLCEGRPVCSPNPGFMEQLDVFEEMLKAQDSGKADAIYQKWLNERVKMDWWAWRKQETVSKAKM
ncbi:hypothetical protein LTR56_007152 [Elasticomyces elasticus]|nr:hypothetical protein LTR22_014443 [Elasticomyces elasticus]KAK3649020.1 hypothetical protein LTR56_007152 [Elasticomyces elasticus]KAK4913263.1 hypothetical protein LTR49_018438 [Elasticomyces elasticus]KAK5752188.1 hypothetical protein LTS12_017685 [Elasticomyces elasticus]